MRRTCNCRYKSIHTSAVVGARVLVGAVLLGLTTPGLRRSGRGENGDGSSSSQQRSSSVGQHVVMLHNKRIWDSEWK